MTKFTATKNDEGRTLLKFLEATLHEVPKSRIEKLFRNKDLKLNGSRTKDKKYIVKDGDEIEVYGVRFGSKTYDSVPVEFETIFEDDNILIVNKPINVEVHGSTYSLDNQVLSYLEFEQTDSFVPSHVGRIDKATSGLMVYGKNYKTVRQLNEKIAEFDKFYRLRSELKEDITMDELIHHNERDKKEYISNEIDWGKRATTIFKVLGDGEVEAQIITGRKHQIRATLEYLGVPVQGDVKYGGKTDKRVYLHSHRIVFKGLENELEYLNNKEFKTGPYFQ